MTEDLTQDAVARHLTSIMLERFQFAQRAGLDTFLGKRNLGTAFGYQDVITLDDYRQRYERGGIAGKIVDAYPKATWRGGVELIEDETPDTETAFETAWLELAERLDICSIFQRADTLCQLAEYSVLLIGAPGEVNTPLPKAAGSSKTISFFLPVTQSNVSITRYDENDQSPRFGQPLEYTITMHNFARSLQTKAVHWTRVHHIAENTLEDPLAGQPRLKRSWNRLDDLEKVIGGGSEAFFQRANQGMAINVDKQAQFAGGVNDPELTAIQDQADKYFHHMTRLIKTRAADVKMLGSDVADFSGPATAIVSQIAGCEGMPVRILIGSERGQLASTQDRDNWDTQVSDRRLSFGSAVMVRPLVNRLIEHNYLPKPVTYSAVWSEAKQMNETERAAGANAWARVNQAQGSTVFTDDEIRDHWYQMEPLDSSLTAQPLTASQRLRAAKWRIAINRASSPSSSRPLELARIA